MKKINYLLFYIVLICISSCKSIFNKIEKNEINHIKINIALTEQNLPNKISSKNSKVELTGGLDYFFSWANDDSLDTQIIFKEPKDTSISVAIRFSPSKIAKFDIIKDVFYETTGYTFKDSLIEEKYWQISASETHELSLCTDSTLIELAFSTNIIELTCEELIHLESFFYIKFDEKVKFDTSVPLDKRYNIAIPSISIETMDEYKKPLLEHGLVLEEKELRKIIRVIEKSKMKN